MNSMQCGCCHKRFKMECNPVYWGYQTYAPQRYFCTWSCLRRWQRNGEQADPLPTKKHKQTDQQQLTARQKAQREYYQRHREEILAKDHEEYNRRKQTDDSYYDRNREARLAYQNEYNRRKRKKAEEEKRAAELERHRAYYEANKERILARQRARRAEHREEVHAYYRQYYQEHKEQYRQSGQKWRDSHREHYREQTAAYKREKRKGRSTNEVGENG